MLQSRVRERFLAAPRRIKTFGRTPTRGISTVLQSLALCGTCMGLFRSKSRRCCKQPPDAGLTRRARWLISAPLPRRPSFLYHQGGRTSAWAIGVGLARALVRVEIPGAEVTP